MTRHEIQNCTDIEDLKELCLAQRRQLTIISEILVDESKKHITTKRAIEKIRDYLVKHQYDLKLKNND